jgi:glycine/D-amino acid oxidase-like deaminating enzyme
VLVLDRRGPVRGATVASTALLQYDIDTPLIHLARRVGWDAAVRIWRRSRLALDALRERVRHLEIEAGCENRDSLYLDGNVLRPRLLQREAAARRRAGFEVAFLGPREVERRTGIRRRSAILSFDDMQADPRRLAAGFLRAAAARRARLCAPVDVVQVTPGPRRTRVITGGGSVVTTRFVVFATGYEVPTVVPQRGHAIASTWAMATRPQPRALWTDRSLVWEASSPYLYLRTTDDGRVICGGEDEPFSSAAARDALLPQKTRTLERRLHRLLPHC